MVHDRGLHLLNFEKNRALFFYDSSKLLYFAFETMVKTIDSRTARRIRRHRLIWCKHNAIREKKEIAALERDAKDVLEAWGLFRADVGSVGARRVFQGMHERARRYYLEDTTVSFETVKRRVFFKELKQKFAKVHRRKSRSRRLRRYIRMVRATVYLVVFQRRVLRWLWRPGGSMASRTYAHFAQLSTLHSQ